MLILDDIPGLGSLTPLAFPLPGAEELDFALVPDGLSPNHIARMLTLQKGAEDPFYVLDIDDVVRKMKKWNLLLPRVKPFYAVKCNTSGALLSVLAEMGAGFDCASKGEIESVLSLGVSPERIVFANPCKTNGHIRFAQGKGVCRMTFDNMTELAKIKRLFPDAELLLRIKAEALEAQCPLGAKFGADPADAPALIDRAISLGLTLIGVSFHVGSGCNDLTAYPRAIAASRRVFRAAEERGVRMNVLDIGGGYPGHPGPWASFEQLSETIRDALDDHFPAEDWLDGEGALEVIAEPGRFFASSAVTLATCVIAKRALEEISDKKEDPSSEATTMYYVNDGLYGSFNCLLFDHAAVEPKLTEEPAPGSDLIPSSVWGPTCDSLDIICQKVLLPRLDVGDWLLWPHMGAYTSSAASTFNGFPKARPVIIASRAALAQMKEIKH